MIEDLNWGLPMVFDLFLAGMGAGALTVSASVFLRGGHGAFGGGFFQTARLGALAAPVLVGIGSALLVLELGSFQAGHWFRFLNLYKVIEVTSPMWIGSWLMLLLLVLGGLFALTFVSPNAAPDDRWKDLRSILAWVGVPLGIAVATYTGFLLSAMPSRPFWNSATFPLLFAFSALATAVALITLTRAVLSFTAFDPVVRENYHEGGYVLSASLVLLIGLELLVIFLFILSSFLSVGDVKEAISVILVGGSLATLFWVWVVVIGLVLPGVVGLWFVVPRLLYGRPFAVPRGVDVLVSIAVLVGGLMLRYVVLVAGQITGPVGI